MRLTEWVREPWTMTDNCASVPLMAAQPRPSPQIRWQGIDRFRCLGADFFLRAGWSLLAIMPTLGGCASQDYHAAPLPVFMVELSQPGHNPEPESSPRKSPPVTTEIAKTPKSLTLDQAIRRALEADPRIPAGFESIRQAEADLVSAGLLPNPQLLGDLLMMPWGKPFSVKEQGGPPQTDYFVGFPIDWFLFGKRAAAMVVAQKGVDVATAQFADLVRQRIRDTIAAFYDVLEAQAQTELARADLKALKQLQQITTTRVELGGVGTIEIDRVKLGIFSAQREVRNREMLLTSARARLNMFLGFSEDIPLTLAGSLDVKQPASPLDMETAFHLASENRPDLIALQRQIETADASVAAEESKALPQVKPIFGFTRQFQQEFFNYPDANSWNIAMEMSVPLFDRNQGNIEKAKSLRTQSQLNHQAQLVELRAEIVQALKSFEAAREALLNDDPGQLEAAQNVRDKIRAAYELGGKPLIDVLDSQRAYRETYRLHIASRSGYWHSLNALNAVVGKQVLK